jgi:hypothetical protein
MKIKKLEEVVTYKQIAKSYKFDVNGKEVNVSHWQKIDDQFDVYESDTEIDEEDKVKLSEDECDSLDEYLSEAMELEDNEELEV